MPAIAVAKDKSEYAVSEQINNAHTGGIDFAAGFAPPLVRAWTTDLGLGEYPRYQAIIADNRVVLSATGVDVFSLDLATGKQKWKHSLPCCNEQGAYDQHKLFFLSDSGLMTALSAKTEDELWNVQLTEKPSFPTAPVAADGRIYASGEGSNAIAYSLRDRDGKLVWSKNLIGDGLPTLGEGGLFLTSGCFYYRLSPTDGTLIWEHDECAGGGPDSAAYMNGRLYVPQYRAGDVVDAATGNVVGSYPTYGATPAVFALRRRIFGVSQQGDTTLGCWNAETGELVWQFAADYEIQTSPIVVNGVAYITDSSGNLCALNAKKGKKIWSENVGDYAYAPILSAGQDTLVVIDNSKVIAYRAQ